MTVIEAARDAATAVMAVVVLVAEPDATGGLVVIVGSAVVFNESISGLNAVGCTICIVEYF